MKPPIRAGFFSGKEFYGHDDLARKDISDCVIEGFGGKAAKPKLDDFDWDGSAVAGRTL